MTKLEANGEGRTAERRDTVPVSVLVPIRNEAANLPRCLGSVAWADDIWVVDSESTDGSQRIAESLGAQVVQFVFNGKWPKKRNWALETLPFKHEWVFLLDADEELPPEAEAEIRAIVSDAGGRTPEAGCRTPEAGGRRPEAGLSVGLAKTEYQTPDDRGQTPEGRRQTPEGRRQMPEGRRQTPEAGDQKLGSELQSPSNTEPPTNNTINGYWINRRFMFMGKWLRHAYFPNWNLRLFRHRLGRFEKLTDADTASGPIEIHEHMIVEGKTARLNCLMNHFAFPSVESFVEKHNTYSNWEARVALDRYLRGSAKGIQAGNVGWRRKLKAWSHALPCRPFLRFCYVYFWQRGFLDGREGYYFARLHAVYELLCVAKQYELSRRRR